MSAFSTAFGLAGASTLDAHFATTGTYAGGSSITMRVVDASVEQTGTSYLVYVDQADLASPAVGALIASGGYTLRVEFWQSIPGARWEISCSRIQRTESTR